jgi:hypothetical protein
VKKAVVATAPVRAVEATVDPLVQARIKLLKGILIVLMLIATEVAILLYRLM